MGMQIAPSILSADFANLEAEIVKVDTADWLHVDVMDGHFVANLTLGLPVLERIAEVSPMPIDAHLMIDDPDTWAPRYAQAGAASVTFHYEAARDPLAIARELRRLGARAAVALKPGTGVDVIIDDLAHFDMVLVMTVEPGFGGQQFMPVMMDKVRALRAAARDMSLDLRIQTDGGISRDTIATVARAGGDIFVAGSAIYQAPDPAAEVTLLRDLATAAVRD